MTLSGYTAAFTFFAFTGLGYAAQVIRLIARRRDLRSGKLEGQKVCEGLHPVREMWSYLAFFSFALSGLTRSYLDIFLLGSRFPILILSTIIFWFLAQDGTRHAKRFFYIALAGVGALIVLTVLASLGIRAHGPLVTQAVDISVTLISVMLFYGKSLQAWTMYRDSQSRGVSWLREIGVFMKDLTGLWYALSIGYELRWVSLTHVFSGTSSFLICLAKWAVERRFSAQARTGL